MDSTSLIKSLLQDFQLEISPNKSIEEIKAMLAEHITVLINTDLNKLYSLLYRIDISENKLKSLLKDNPEQDAALMIADLIIERQVQKLKSRQETRRDNDIDENEKW